MQNPLYTSRGSPPPLPPIPLQRPCFFLLSSTEQKKRSRRSSTQQGGIWGGLKVFIQNNHPPSLTTIPLPSFPLFSNSHKLKTRARFVFVGGGAAVQQVNFRFGFYGNSCWRCPPPSFQRPGDGDEKFHFFSHSCSKKKRSK